MTDRERRSDRTPDREDPFSRKPWCPPEVTELPPLSDLTLQSSDPIDGGGGSGGGTVF